MVTMRWYINRNRKGLYCVYLDGRKVWEGRTLRGAILARNKMQRDINYYAKTGRWKKWR